MTTHEEELKQWEEYIAFCLDLLNEHLRCEHGVVDKHVLSAWQEVYEHQKRGNVSRSRAEEGGIE